MRFSAAVTVVWRAVIVEHAVHFLAFVCRDARKREGFSNVGQRSESYGTRQERAQKARVDTPAVKPVALQRFDSGDDAVDRLLCVTEEHDGLGVVEERVVDPGEA